MVLMAALSLVLAGPALGQAEFRAFWADVWTSSFMTSAQVNEMVTRAVTGRYNAIVPVSGLRQRQPRVFLAFEHRASFHHGHADV